MCYLKLFNANVRQLIEQYR